jgi:hypothetical protein
MVEGASSPTLAMPSGPSGGLSRWKSLLYDVGRLRILAERFYRNLGGLGSASMEWRHSCDPALWEFEENFGMVRLISSNLLAFLARFEPYCRRGSLLPENSGVIPGRRAIWWPV